jgi:hypothetical protein
MSFGNRESRFLVELVYFFQDRSVLFCCIIIHHEGRKTTSEVVVASRATIGERRNDSLRKGRTKKKKKGKRKEEKRGKNACPAFATSGRKEEKKYKIQERKKKYKNQFSSQSKNSGVKYDTIILAPALKMPSVASKAIVFLSKTPAFAAAQIMAYSPETWYAATGRSLPISLASLIMSR